MASIVHFRQQSRNDLHLLIAILILLPVDFGRLRATLLLRLASFYPLLHRQVLTQTRQVIILQTKAVQQRTVGDRIKDDMVVGPRMKY